MPATKRSRSESLDRLDARHDELLARLDELHGQVEQALGTFARHCGTGADASEKRSRSSTTVEPS